MLAEANRYRYAHLRPKQIQEVIHRCPVVIQPSGLLEWHGDHNPIGLDGLMAQYISERVIIQFGDGVIMPPNWIGTYGYIGYPGTVCFNEQTTIDVFVQYFQQMIKLGFKVILILLGHWGKYQENVLRKARETVEKQIKKQGLKIKILGVRYGDFLLGQKDGGHAQEGETSMIWRMSQHYGLDLVDLSQFKMGDEIVPLYKVDDPKNPHCEPNPWHWDTNLLDSKICSPEIGEKMISSIAEVMAEELKEQLAEIQK
jgi:creatinine amidohydrolase/Fe(II)-dependent formamide hydrolase-like protein